MRDIYDILVNFKKYPYEFYEWEKEDNIDHVKKIKAVKTNDKTLFDIINYDVKITGDLLKEIEYKTDVFKNHKVINLKYALIVHNECVAIALLLNDDGMVIKKSKLLFDEEDDVIRKGLNSEILKIKYEVVSLKSNNLKCTRKESETINLLLKYINNIYVNKNEDELKYVYFECFDENQKDYKKAYENLKSSILNLDFNIINKLKNLINVIKR